MALVSVPEATATIGGLDPSFGAGGRVSVGSTVFKAVALQPDGRIVVTGTDGTDILVARFLPDGARDPSFGGDGIVTTDAGGPEDVANALVVLPDGKLAVAGTNRLDFVLVRYETDGSRDETFGNGGIVVSDVSPTSADDSTTEPEPREVANALVAHPDGRLVAAGKAATPQGADSDFALARYLADGSLDQTFGVAGVAISNAGYQSKIKSMVTSGTNYVVAGVAAGESLQDVVIGRYTADGRVDPTFGPGGIVHTDLAGTEAGYALTAAADGDFVVAGQFDNRLALFRYTSEGKLDTSFGTNGAVKSAMTGIAQGVTVDAGKLVVAGTSGGAVAVARYEDNGSSDLSFGTDGVVLTDFDPARDDVAHALVVEGTTAVIAGASTETGGAPNGILARYLVGASEGPVDTAGTTAPGKWSAGADLLDARAAHTTTVLQSGMVLAVGGTGISGTALASAEVFRPSQGTWERTGSVSVPRDGHTATLLADGRVLIAGGFADDGQALLSAETFDPQTGTWGSTGNLGTARGRHTASLLGDGSVLVVGGRATDSDNNGLASAERYNPEAGQWEAITVPASAYIDHTATVLADGRVMVLGRAGSGEIYDPSSGNWTATAPRPWGLVPSGGGHTATLLSNGDVFFTGGFYAMHYRPSSNTWARDAGMHGERVRHTATTVDGGICRLTPRPSSCGKVLVAGTLTAPGGDPGLRSEVYDAEADRWLDVGPIASARHSHSAILLPEGLVLISGGQVADSPAAVLKSTELFDPAPPVVTSVDPAVLDSAGGEVVTITGMGFEDVQAVHFNERRNTTDFEVQSDSVIRATAPPHGGGTADVVIETAFGRSATGPSARLEYRHHDFGRWSATNPMPIASANHHAISLGGPACRGPAERPAYCGRVLVIAPGEAVTQLYDPVSGTWRSGCASPGPTCPGLLGVTRLDFSATLLDGLACHAQSPPSYCGKVLVAGGIEQSPAGRKMLDSTELYDPATGTWAFTGTMKEPRYQHTATVLPSGSVVLAGGIGLALRPHVTNNPQNMTESRIVSSEVYDAALGQWRATGPMQQARTSHTASLVPQPQCTAKCGKVLVAGGLDQQSSTLSSVEVFDEAADGGAGAWTAVEPLVEPRRGHSASVLAGPGCAAPFPVCGRLLLTGGIVPGANPSASVVVYDPSGSPRWTAGTSMPSPRAGHTATVLSDGRLLVVGGALASATVLDPGPGQWSPTPPMSTTRDRHTATLLVDGTVLVAGGSKGTTPKVSSADLYLPSPIGVPKVTAITPPSGPPGRGQTVVITGENLDRTESVAFGAAAARVLFRSRNELIVEAPAQPQGMTVVAVRTALYESRPSTGATYTYGAGSWHDVASPGAVSDPGESTARFLHTATRLDAPACHGEGPPAYCGQVLVVGGTAGRFADRKAFSAAFLYDPKTEKWSSAAHLATSPRHSHTATLLADGRVLVAGGQASTVTAMQGQLSTAFAEVYEPWNDTWKPVPPMTRARSGHTASLLPTGGVLVAGGADHETSRWIPMAQAEVFHPDLNSWAPAAPMTEPRIGHTATGLSDGRVLVAGGLQLQGVSTAKPSSTAEIYDPATRLWTASAPLAVARSAHSATLLPDGSVLVVGGRDGRGPIASAERFSVTSMRWDSASSSFAAHSGHTATLLENGTVLVAGSGPTFPGELIPPESAAEIYHPDQNRWRRTDMMEQVRGAHSATLLGGPDCRVAAPPAYCGGVLVFGGTDVAPPPGLFVPATDSAEVYTPLATVSRVSPARGPQHGGDRVVLGGSGFTKAVSVRIGGTQVPQGALSRSSSGEIAVNAVPASSSTGAHEVTVTNAAGSSAALVPEPSSFYTFVGRPGPVGRLAAVPLSPTSLRLEFDAADDGGGDRPASSYEVRQAVVGADPGDPEQSVLLCGGLCTVPPAVSVRLAVTDLSPGTEYYFSLRAVNEFGAKGPATAVSGTTLPDTGVAGGAACPQIDVVGAHIPLSGGRYHLVGLPTGSVLGGNTPLYSWSDQGAGGAYGVQSASGPVTGGRSYWTWAACDRKVILPDSGVAAIRLRLGAYHASMVGNPSASAATLNGHDFAARWNHDMNNGAGGYELSAYRSSEVLGTGEGRWVFSYADTQIRIDSNSP